VDKNTIFVIDFHQSVYLARASAALARIVLLCFWVNLLRPALLRNGESYQF